MRSVVFLIFALLAIAVVFLLPTGSSAPASMAYSELRRRVEAGEVKQVQISSDEIRGTLTDGTQFVTTPVPDELLVPELLERGVEVVGQRPSGAWGALGWLLPFGAFLLFFWWMRRSQGAAPPGALALGKSKARVYLEKQVQVTFDDVAGVDEAKEELREVLTFLKTPEKFGKVGGKLPKGILLVGPPGTGKTLLARAVAGEAAVPFLSLSGSEFVEMFVGVGAARVRDLFAQARSLAPCIIFIDELDALGKVRGLGPQSHDEREQTLNQLLVELDGFDPRAGVVLMAATNRPEILDPALLRGGRFDRHVVVDRPDRVGRLAILKVHTRKVTLGPDADLAAIAGMTAGMAGADLANLVNEAALLAVRRGLDAVGAAELDEAVERVVAGLQKRGRGLAQAERERVAHHEVGHALVAMSLGGDPVRKISIIPRGIAALGYTLQLPAEDRHLATQAQLEDRLATLLGGRAAEELVYGDVSTGAQDDLLQATDLARRMVTSFGMSAAIGPLSFDRGGGPFAPPFALDRAPVSEAVAEQIDREVRRILDEQHARSRRLLRERLGTLRTAAHRLLEQETLDGAELQALMAGTNGAMGGDHVLRANPAGA
jgi:cell division protease FtsH